MSIDVRRELDGMSLYETEVALERVRHRIAMIRREMERTRLMRDRPLSYAELERELERKNRESLPPPGWDAEIPDRELDDVRDALRESELL